VLAAAAAIVAPSALPVPVAQAAPDMGYRGLVPVRLLDTRQDEPAPYAAASVHGLAVAGAHGVPADAQAVAINVTVDQPQSAGFLTLYPCDSDRPTASNLNFAAGETIASATTVFLGADLAGHDLCIFTSATSEVIVDLNGVYSPSGGRGLLTTFRPARILDTREPTGQTQGSPVNGIIFQVAGRNEVPADATAAILTVTVDQPEAAGFITLAPCGGWPLASNLNFLPGQTISNTVIVDLSSSGYVCFNSNVRTHLIVDATAAFSPTLGTARLVRTPIQRLADTRLATSPTGGAPLVGGSILEVPVRGTASVPDQVSAVTLNVAVDAPEGPGFLTVFPCGIRNVLASNVNFAAGQTIANSVTIGVGTNGDVCVYTMTTAHVVVDLDAAFVSGPS
jgi:hypothetical protein